MKNNYLFLLFSLLGFSYTFSMQDPMLSKSNKLNYVDDLTILKKIAIVRTNEATQVGRIVREIARNEEVSVFYYIDSTDLDYKEVSVFYYVDSADFDRIVDKFAIWIHHSKDIKVKIKIQGVFIPVEYGPREDLLKYVWDICFIGNRIRYSLDLDVAGYDNITPLMHTLRPSLIEHGANVDAVNSHGNTALCKAVSLERNDIAQKLLEYSADPNLGTNKPLTIAAMRRNLPLITMLVRAGAHIESANISNPNMLAHAHKIKNELDHQRRIAQEQNENLLTTIQELQQTHNKTTNKLETLEQELATIKSILYTLQGIPKDVDNPLRKIEDAINTLTSELSRDTKTT